MNNTLTYLKQFTTPELLSLSSESVVSEYQSLSAIKQINNTPYIATLFVKLYSYIWALRRKYPTLDSETCSTAALEAINIILETFDVSKKTRVSTRFYSVYKRILYREFRPFMYKKRNLKIKMESLDDENENMQSLYDSIIDDRYETRMLNVETTITLFEVCPEDCAVILDYIIQGYNAKEISKIMEVPYSRIQNKLKKMRKVFAKDSEILI